MPNNSLIECGVFDAIQRGQHDEVRRLLDATPSLLVAYDHRCFGATPITSIALRGADSHDLRMIQLLIDLGADINRRSEWWAGPWSPLHCAICVGNNALAEFLLGRGAILDAHTAAAMGKRDELMQLLDADPTRVHERGGDGCPPLHFAGTVDCAERLVALGADINLRSGRIHNNSPAGWAIVAGSHRVFSLLMDHKAQIHPWFAEDAQTAIDGGFRKYKPSTNECYAAIQGRLRVTSVEAN